MVHRNTNFHKGPLTGIKPGDTIEDCNCTQQEMNTIVCEGLTGLTVIKGNIRNCIFPSDTIFIGVKPYQKEMVTEPEPTESDIVKSELEFIKSRYGALATEEAKNVFNLTAKKVVI